MKANRTLMATLAIGSLLAFSPLLGAADTNAPATGRPQAGMRGHMMGPIDRLAKELNLTDDQKTKVQTVLEDQRTKMIDLFKDSSLSREDRRTKMMAIHNDTNAKMKEILTPDQYAQFEKMGPGMRQRRNQGGGNMNTNAPAANTKPQS